MKSGGGMRWNGLLEIYITSPEKLCESFPETHSYQSF